MNRYDESLKHYGVLGMRWGVTRTRNRFGTFEVRGRNVAREIMKDKRVADISSKALDLGRRWLSKKFGTGAFGRLGGSRGASSGRRF